MKSRSHQFVSSCRTVCVNCNTVRDVLYLPPELPQLIIINLHHLNLISETDRRKTYEARRVTFTDENQLEAAEFYFTILCDMVLCGFCVLKWVARRSEMMP